MNKSFIPLIFGLLFSGIFIGVGVLFLSMNQNLQENGIETEGVVIENLRSRDSDGTTYTPVVEFQLENGESVTETMNYSSNPPSYNVGDPIPIIYMPGDPSSASINTTFWMVTFPWIFIGTGIFVQLIMTLVFFSTRKRVKAMESNFSTGTTSDRTFSNTDDEEHEKIYTKPSDNKDKGKNPFLMD